jgi:hypothetical protein
MFNRAKNWYDLIQKNIKLLGPAKQNKNYSRKRKLFDSVLNMEILLRKILKNLKTVGKVFF